jgi:hypothetical protein
MVTLSFVEVLLFQIGAIGVCAISQLELRAQIRVL